MKFTKNTSAYRGTFNEVKIIDFLIKFSNCKPVNNVLPDNYAEILATMSPIEMECETNRAYKMAEMIFKYWRENLNWFMIENILWTGIPKAFDDPILDSYYSHKNPADLVLIAPNNQYLGVSLKNYTNQTLIGHKRSVFSSFGHENPLSRAECLQSWELIIANFDPQSIFTTIFHVPEHPYIEVIGKGDYHREEYILKKPLTDFKDMRFNVNHISNKVDFDIDGVTGNISFYKNANRVADYFSMQTFINI